MNNATEVQEPFAAPALKPVQARGKVLIIDDEASLLEVMKRTLSAEHEICMLQSAGEAVKRIGGGERFDAILCDMWMPWMSGLEFLRKLQDIDPAQAKKLILISGDSFTTLESAVMRESASGCLSKPFALKSLLKRVREVVETKTDGAH